MNIEQIKECKKKMISDIMVALIVFERETKLHVDDIKIERAKVTRGYETPPISKVSVKVVI